MSLQHDHHDDLALRHPVAKGWFVHCVTALGALCGMFGLMAVTDKDFKMAIVWLAIAMIVDGIDGPAARAWEVRTHVPRIDGYTLDLIIDYVTCIVIPVLFMLRFDMLPHDGNVAVASVVLFLSALWMSRTDQMTDDKYFNGFPCEWNMIVPTLYLLDTSRVVNGVVCLLLALTQLTNWKFIHPMQVRKRRVLNVSVTILWLAVVLLMTAQWPNHDALGKALLVACPLYIVGVGAWRTFGPEAELDRVPAADAG